MPVDLSVVRVFKAGLPEEVTAIDKDQGVGSNDHEGGVFGLEKAFRTTFR